MRTITAQDLHAKLERPNGLWLIDVLPQESHVDEHIPGAVNVPVAQEHFAEAVRRRVGDRTVEIVVYDSGADSEASAKAAQRLLDAGFEEVSDLAGGLEEWRAAGYPLAGETTRAADPLPTRTADPLPQTTRAARRPG